MKLDNFYLACDPGHTSGYAVFNSEGIMMKSGQISGLDDFMDFVEDLDPQPHVLVMEDYIIRKGISHSGSRAPTIQLIGMLKRWAKKNHVEVVLQQAHVKKIGYKFAGLKQTKTHDKSHEPDAIAHGCFYLRRIKVRL